MAAYDGSRVKVGPGTLYAAPLGTTEPTAVTGAWPANWVQLGYTVQGSQFDIQSTFAPVTPDEEYFPVLNVPTTSVGTLVFALMEQTMQNLLLELNAGIGSSQVAATHGTNADGSLWAEPVAVGGEVRVMLGWDALSSAGTGNTDSFGRLIVRKAVQTGNIQIAHRKGANPVNYNATFSIEKPAGIQPVRFLFPALLAA